MAFQFLKEVPKTLKELLIADPKDFIGNAYAVAGETPEELIKDAKASANLLSGANLIDFSLGQSILFFAFANLGFPLGIALSCVTNLIILKLKNDSGVIVARARPGADLTRSFGFASLLFLNLLSCGVAGIGAELTLNQSGLANLKAQQIIDKAELEAKKLQPDSRLYDEAKKECDKLEVKLGKLKPGDSEYDTTYVRANGMFRERSRVWKLKESGIPVCVKSKLLYQIIVNDSAELGKDWQEKMQVRTKLGNDLMFVKETFPSQYAQHFKTDEEMRSGVEAIELAWGSFFGKLSRGDYAGLGASLFFASLSTITSLTACGVVFAFSQNKQAQNSWDPEFARLLSKKLEGQTDTKKGEENP